MDEIEKLDQLIDMLGTSISDVSFCKEDLEKIDEDFILKYPDCTNPDLSNDRKKMLDNIKTDYLYFRRRSYVKTAFSSMEGVLFAMKRILLSDSRNLTDEEIIKLQEYKLIGPSENKLKKDLVFLRTEDNIKFVIRTYEKVKVQGIKTDFNCKEWEEFKIGINIRNRITHPKHSSDLLITENELEIISHAYDWFFKVFHNLQNNEID